uniref:Solute-binding protein family 3/N-terminal domain-containing protein n=1 Tax=Tetranychus urticae TaxID=32264 RepID=T1KYJ5_TETUR
MFKMEKRNLTVGAFSVPYADGFVEEDGEIVPKLKSLKRLAAIITDYGPFNLKFHLPETGQLGIVTETGYHDGVLGLMQEEKVEMCFLPLALDTVKAPGGFTPVISEESYYISSIRNLNDGTSAVVSSLASVNTIPIILAILIVLLLELVVTKHFNIESIVNVIYQSFGTSFYQNLSRHSAWFCLILMIILMFPVYIFDASFSTQTIVGTNDVKIDTLRDVITYGKISFFIEGISMYDWFKAKVTKDYGDIYERSKSNGLDKPFELGPVPIFRPADRMVLPVSTLGVKIAPLVAPEILGPSQVHYFSERPFHKSVQALLLSFKTPKSIKRRVNIITQRVAQAGLATKIEADIYIESILSFHPASLFDFYKSEIPRNSLESWY